MAAAVGGVAHIHERADLRRMNHHVWIVAVRDLVRNAARERRADVKLREFAECRIELSNALVVDATSAVAARLSASGMVVNWWDHVNLFDEVFDFRRRRKWSSLRGRARKQFLYGNTKDF
jgi:hypothetical protein